jgi:hypothetical protein
MDQQFCIVCQSKLTRAAAIYCSFKCRRKTIIRKCHCGVEFETVPSINQKNCSRKCIVKTPEQREKIAIGVKKYMAENPLNAEQRLKRGEQSKGKPAWNSGTASIIVCIACGTSFKALGKRKHTAKWCSLKCKSAYCLNIRHCDLNKHLYYKQVKKITESQDLKSLSNYDKRGKLSRNKDAHHLDHIIPIKYGYIHKIPPEIIGNISNLQFIPALKNHKKSSKYESINNNALTQQSPVLKMVLCCY